MKYSLCVESIFPKIPIYDRFELVNEFKPDAVEFWDIHEYDTKKLGAIIAKYGFAVALCCLNNNWKVRMNDSFSRVKKNIEESIETGKDIGCNTFICMSGDVTNRTDSQKMIITENLKRIAEICEKKNANLLVEPLNSLYDHKSYYLDNAYDGFEIIKTVDSPRIKLLFDCYHMQVMQGNLVNSISDNIDYIGHVHSAGVPGRKELHLGETNYPLIIQTLDELGYTGYFGLEYFPSYDSKQSLTDVFNYVRK